MKTPLQLLIFCLFLVSIFSSKEQSKTTAQQTTVDPEVDWAAESGLSREAFHDKVMGILIGSAIGDAIGAPTEIWSREEIRKVYGFVEGLEQRNLCYPPALEKAYALLDENLQDIPFHAGEISLQVYTAMIFSEFDFMNTLVFLTNYGRGNDTTAALAGAILGTYYGHSNLPEKEGQQVMRVSKDLLDLDLEQVAANFTNSIFSK